MAKTMVECPCCHGAKRLTVIEHDGDGGTFLTKPQCSHCMGKGTIEAEVRESLPWWSCS